MGLFRKKPSKSAAGTDASDAAAPYQVLLIRPTWLDLGGAQSPSANIVHISRALLEIVDVSPSVSYDLCAELNDRGVAVLVLRFSLWHPWRLVAASLAHVLVLVC